MMRLRDPNGPLSTSFEDPRLMTAMNPGGCLSALGAGVACSRRLHDKPEESDRSINYHMSGNVAASPATSHTRIVPLKAGVS